MDKKIIEIIGNSIGTKKSIMDSESLVSNIKLITEEIINAFQRGNKVLFCGNGGSAADAQHLAAEFSGRFFIDRKPLYSEALHCNSSYVTAVANDYGYEKIFSRVLEGIGNQGDILVGISTSGNSKNITEAFKYANSNKIITIALLGANDGEMGKLANYKLNVPSTITPRIQESHILVGHIICELTEKELFENK